MFKTILLALVSLLTSPFSCNAQKINTPEIVIEESVQAPIAPLNTSNRQFVNHVLVPATFEMYTENESGVFAPICTMAAIAKSHDSASDGTRAYLFVSASHCVSEQDEKGNEKQRAKWVFVRVAHQDGTVEFLPVEVLAAGCQSCGEDFSLLSVLSKLDIPTLPLGSDPLLFGEPVWNMSAPLGRGLKFFPGVVSNPALTDRPNSFDDINWEGVFSVQLYGVNPGSSGSPVVCANQEAICGILVGQISRTYTAVMPVSRLKIFIQKYFKTQTEVEQK